MGFHLSFLTALQCRRSKTRMRSLPERRKGLRYVHSFRHITGLGQTERATDWRICYNNIALCMHRMLTRNNKVTVRKRSHNMASARNTLRTE